MDFRSNRLARRVAVAVAAVLAMTIVGPASASAQVAPDAVLVLEGTVSGGASSIEATEAAAQGLRVDVVDTASWSTMNADQFSSCRAIILGDATCAGLGPDIEAAAANARTWGPIVDGNIVITGTDPVFHASQGGAT